MIKEKQIEMLADTRAAYQRGCDYFQQGKIIELRRPSVEHYIAQIHGSVNIYNVSVRLLNDETIQRCSCDCPAYYQYEGACKHIVAVLKAIQTKQRTDSDVARTASPTRLLTLFKNFNQKNRLKEEPVALLPVCYLNINSRSISAWLEFTIGRTRKYVVKNVEQLLQAMLFRQKLVYGKAMILEPDTAVFDTVSQKLLDMMLTSYEDERSLQNAYVSSSLVAQKKFRLTPSGLSKFLTIMQNQNFMLSIDGKVFESVEIIEGRPPIKISLKEDFGKGNLSLGRDRLVNIDNHFKYILYNNSIIYKVDSEFSAVIRPILQCLREGQRQEISIDAAGMSDFFGVVMPEIEKIAPVKVASSFMNKYDILPLNASVYFDQYGEGICAILTFGYGGVELNPADQAANFTPIDGKILIRDIAAEQQILDFFTEHDFITKNGIYIQQDEEKSYDFIVNIIPKLFDYAEVYYADNFHNKEVKKIGRVSIGISINDHSMLDMSLKNDEFSFTELMDILASYRLKKKYHRLKDGAFVSLTGDELQGIADFMSQMVVHAPKAGNTLQMPLAKAMYLDSLARESNALKVERSNDFKKMVQDITEPLEADIVVPDSLTKVLREYQLTGFKWLRTLAHYGLGGILADDMGLGKTLQVIAFVLSTRSMSPLSVLVVTPTSLLYNWLEEIKRFAPELKVSIINGVQNERLELLDKTIDVDIVLTTYNLLKRDIEIYKEQEFQYCFLDEAQYIKNPNTQNAKSVKLLKAKGYFALTGTPIENTLTELWSIFDWLMPGYLLSHQAFKKRFEVPIAKNSDIVAAKDLHRYIAPFVLRRLKKDVLKELPPKTESKMINEMTDEQKKVYMGFFLQAQQEFAEELKKRGFEQSRIKILAILTRLRQICCHPSLFIADYYGGSGKLNMLCEVVDNALESGHHLLIFSQFTSMLSIIRNELEKRAIDYSYLDGQTPALERIHLVREFNQGSKSVFLISLKAGGTGLNLTGADMVIHYDPWWNPAVEEQATDRAYRLGQKKNVQVFKFITKDTIEEKIFLMQQQKKGLIDKMIQPGETFVSKLSEEELRSLFNC